MRSRFLLFLLLSVGAQAQIFSYPATPVNCSHSNAAYPSTDLDLCTLPGETPFSTFPVPAVGASYIDANFGSTVTVLASFAATGPGAVHTYYSPSALSATGKYALIAVNTFARFINATTGALVCQTSSGMVTSPDATPTWDATNDDFLWYWSGTKLRKWQISTCTVLDVLDFSTLIDVRTGLAFGFTSMSDGGTGDTSKDNWKAGYSDDAHHTAVLINLNNLHVYAADYTITRNGVTPLPIGSSGSNGYVLTSKGVDSVSGKRYLLVVTFPGNAGGWVIFSLAGDPNNGLLTFEELGPELSPATYAQFPPGNGNNICDPGERCYTAQHQDTMEDSDGQQYIVGGQDVQLGSGAHQERRLIYMRFNAGILMGRTKAENAGGGLTIGWLAQEGGGVDLFLDSHTGCAKSAPYCVYSTGDDLGGVAISPTATTFQHGAHQSVIAVIRGVNLEVRQVAYSRSPRFNNDTYWSYPRACLSNDGSRVLFDSNLGHPNGANNENVLTVSTGYGSAPVLSCDLNWDGFTNVADAQIALNQVLGKAPCTNADLTQSGSCAVVDLQRVVNAALTGVCKIGL